MRQQKGVDPGTLDLEPVKKESSVQLRALIDTLSGQWSFKSVRAYGTNSNSYQINWALFHLISLKLNLSTRRERGSEAAKSKDLRVAILIDFFKFCLRILKAIESVKNMNTQVQKDVPMFKN